MSNQHLLETIRPFLSRPSSSDPPFRAGDVMIRAGSETGAPAVWRIVADIAWAHDRVPDALRPRVRQPGLYGLVQAFSGGDLGVQLERVLDERGLLPERQWIVRIPDVESELAAEYVIPDLLSFRPSLALQRALNARHMVTQRIEDGYGDANFDRFAVHVTRLPTAARGITSAETLLEHIRLDFNSFIDTSVATFGPFDPHVDGPVWSSPTPTGAVLHIAMTDDGAVVCSDRTPSYWRVSTVRAPNDGWHPISGVREWGVAAADGGGFEVYTRAADRFTHTIPWPGTTWARGQQAQLWQSFQTRVAAFVNRNGGHATIRPPMTDHQPWSAVSGSHHPTVSWLFTP